jgi:hypothetical protein
MDDTLLDSSETTQASSQEDRGSNTGWNSYNLLSLGESTVHTLANESNESDGGGIRGYWSLLVLERLMQHVANAEQKLWQDTASNDALPGCTSFYPFQFPDHTSHAPYASDEKSRIAIAGDAAARLKLTDASRRFLPCHYFDFICGTSTGA